MGRIIQERASPCATSAARADSSAAELRLYTAPVVGSIPAPPIRKRLKTRRIRASRCEDRRVRRSVRLERMAASDRPFRSLSPARSIARDGTCEDEGDESRQRGARGVERARGGIPRLREHALARRRQATQQHGRGRVQARRPRAHLPQVHLGRLRGEARRARRRQEVRRRPRGQGRVQRRGDLLGPEGSSLAAPAGQREAAHDRQAPRRRDARDREGECDAQGCLAEGLRTSLARQAAPRRARRSDLGHRPRRQGEPLARRARPRVRVLPLSVRGPPRARKAASSTRPSAWCACSSRCSRRTRAASSIRAADRAACSCRARSSSRRTAAASAT